MGLYSEDVEFAEFGLSEDALIEAFLIDDLTHNYSSEAVKEFCAPGGVGEALVEANIFKNKSTIMRLSKADELTKRTVITAIQMAKAANDPAYHQLVKYQALRKQARAKIVRKYGAKAEKLAIKAQKSYIKAMKNVNISNNANWAGKNDR